MKRYTLIFIMLVATATVYAQNIFWLQGTWRGKAYLPGSDGSQYYVLVMSISEIKGNKFEGIITTMQPSDTSYRFDSKISGVVYDKYLIINRNRVLYVKDAPGIKWKVSCNNCKPPRMLFSLEQGKIFFRGEETDCYKECNGVSEFSKDINEFDSSKKEAVYALVNYAEPSDTTSLAKNNLPASVKSIVDSSAENITEHRIPVLPSSDIVSTKRNANLLSQKETAAPQENGSLLIKENPPQRIALLPVGDIVATMHNNKSLLAYKETVALHKNISLMIKENPPQRIVLLPVGDIVASTHNSINSSSQKEIAVLHKNISLTIKENPPQRIVLLPVGDIVATKNKTELILNKKIEHPLQVKNPSLSVEQNNLVAAKIPLSKDSITLIAKTKDTIQNNIALNRNVVALPADYAERKKNVIRTLTVNTDSVVLRVYDNGIVDGDIVSVIYNDNVVIDKLSLTTRAVEVKIPVITSQINTIVFHAHNLGQYPPNTAKLEIIYGNKKEELTVSSDLTVSSTIDIVHQ